MRGLPSVELLSGDGLCICELAWMITYGGMRDEKILFVLLMDSLTGEME